MGASLLAVAKSICYPWGKRGDYSYNLVLHPFFKGKVLVTRLEFWSSPSFLGFKTVIPPWSFYYPTFGFSRFFSSFHDRYASKSNYTCSSPKIVERFCVKGIYLSWHSQKEFRSSSNSGYKIQKFVAGKYTRARAPFAQKYTNRIFESKNGATSMIVVN